MTKVSKQPVRSIAGIPFPRLPSWIIASVILIAILFFAAPQNLPVVVYKMTLVSLAVVLGFWADVGLFPYARPGDLKGEGIIYAAAMIRRALVVLAVVIGVTLGL